MKGCFLRSLTLSIILYSQSPCFATPNNGLFLFQGSQQPGPLFSFGLFSIDKNQSQYFIQPSYLNLDRGAFTFLEYDYLYGITDNLTLAVAIPYSVSRRLNDNKSTGFSDVGINFEYTLYNLTNDTSSSQLTFVLKSTIPTGSSTKQPPTGLGNPSLLLGATYSTTYADWFQFIESGLTWYAPQHANQAGNYYQLNAGIGRTLYQHSPLSYWFGLVELNCQYFTASKLNGIASNTGGQLLHISPSLIYATNRLYAQLGLRVPVYQQWKTRDAIIDYQAALAIGWTMN